MPLQRLNTEPVRRPSGLVPPVPRLDGVTELRLHGVGGTTPQDLLGDDAPQHVSGDRIAGFYRTADVADRHVEAYSWGGLTSRSGIRVLWLLLFPFAMANLAGWMCTARTHARPWLFRAHRTAVRWAALAITLNLLLLVAITTMDLTAYQCGGQLACGGESWLLRPLRGEHLADHPARRVLAGALVPMLLLTLLAVLTMRSIQRYENIRPPYRLVAVAQPPGSGPGADEPAKGPALRAASARSAAQPGAGLSDAGFWDGQRATLQLGCLHIGAGFGFVGLLLAYVVRHAAGAAGAPIVDGWWWTVVLVLGGLATLGAILLAAPDACPRLAAAGALAAGSLAVLGAAWFALVQPRYAQEFGYLPGMREAANLVLGVAFGTLGLVLIAALLGGWRRGTFRMFGPFVTLTMSVLGLNLVLLAIMNRVADLLGRVATRTALPTVAPAGPELFIYPMAARVVQYLTVLPLLLLLLFVAYELVAYWRAGTDHAERARIRTWYARHVPRPSGETAWQVNTMDDDERARRQRLARLWPMTTGGGWAAGIARARRVARMPHDVDVLLTLGAFISTGLLAAVQIRYWYFHRLPWGTQWTYTLGSYLATGIPLALMLVLRRGWSNLASRRRIGVLWDVCTFWPRAYHPLAPPSYTERAVPELQRRLWRVHDNGGRVVLAAHSQGTVLAAAALAQERNRPPDDRVALVTFGSPLRKLYGWAFPAYFGDDVLGRLSPDRTGPGRPAYAWRNFYYRTDPIGGPVLPGHPDVDVELPDPMSNWYIYGQPEPMASRHSGYWTDAAVWQDVDRLAEELADLPAHRTDASTGALPGQR